MMNCRMAGAEDTDGHPLPFPFSVVLTGIQRSHRELFARLWPFPIALEVVRSYEMSKSAEPLPRKDAFGTGAAYLHSTSDIDILVMLSFAIRYL